MTSKSERGSFFKRFFFVSKKTNDTDIKNNIERPAGTSGEKRTYHRHHKSDKTHEEIEAEARERLAKLNADVRPGKDIYGRDTTQDDLFWNAVKKQKRKEDN